MEKINDILWDFEESHLHKIAVDIENSTLFIGIKHLHSQEKFDLNIAQLSFFYFENSPYQHIGSQEIISFGLQNEHFLTIKSFANEKEYQKYFYLQTTSKTYYFDAKKITLNGEVIYAQAD